MMSTTLPSYVAGLRLEPAAASPHIRSLDGEHEFLVAETSSVQLRKALRFAEDSQIELRQTSLQERVEVARLVLRDYARRADEACWALAQVRGITAADTRWMCQVNLDWADRLEGLVDVMWGAAEQAEPSRPNSLLWRSRGKAALFSSATMDGPPALVALCHAIVSGTHLIFKPSFRDAATHFALDTLYAHGHYAYAQLVRWRSDTPEAQQLNRQLVNHVSQAVIFSSNETYRSILDGAATPATPEWDALRDRVKRYGTGLPLAIVTAGADLDAAARDLVEGARLGGGRFCLSACPVLVTRDVHDALVQKLTVYSQRLQRGSALLESTDLSAHDPAESAAVREVVRSFGGDVAHGAVRESDMDVLVLANVPSTTPALSRELPGTALAVIPVDDLDEAVAVAADALRRNLREAWTALVMFVRPAEFSALSGRIPAFRHLNGGVVARVKLLLPHQGAYFALDLMRRVTVE